MSVQGAISTELGFSHHVRFPPESDRTADMAGGQLCAIDELMRCVMQDGYWDRPSWRGREGTPGAEKESKPKS